MAREQMFPLPGRKDLEPWLVLPSVSEATSLVRSGDLPGLVGVYGQALASLADRLCRLHEAGVSIPARYRAGSGRRKVNWPPLAFTTVHIPTRLPNNEQVFALMVRESTAPAWLGEAYNTMFNRLRSLELTSIPIGRVNLEQLRSNPRKVLGDIGEYPYSVGFVARTYGSRWYMTYQEGQVASFSFEVVLNRNGKSPLYQRASVDFVRGKVGGADWESLQGSYVINYDRLIHVGDNLEVEVTLTDLIHYMLNSMPRDGLVEPRYHLVNNIIRKLRSLVVRGSLPRLPGA